MVKGEWHRNVSPLEYKIECGRSKLTIMENNKNKDNEKRYKSNRFTADNFYYLVVCCRSLFVNSALNCVYHIRMRADFQGDNGGYCK